MPFDRLQPYNDLPDLPPSEVLETVGILKAAVAAARALERLRGTSSQLPNPRMLVNGIVLQEARGSSEVENIVTTNDELYRAAAAGIDNISDPATKEVLRYSEALWYGFEETRKRPLTTSLFVELVRILRQVDVGVRSVPGTNLKTQYGDVIYTPPCCKDVIERKLTNLVNFIHAEDGLDPLIKLAVFHYQFEAIHPFSDGNGRTGRILNVLYLTHQRLLDLPVLYLSQYILLHKREYYDGLRKVTEENVWDAWVLFMLSAVEKTSISACELVEELLALMREAATLFRASYPNAYRKELLEVAFSNPYCRIGFIEAELDVSRPTASSYLQKMAELKILREVRVGRDLYFVNDRMLNVLGKPR